MSGISGIGSSTAMWQNLSATKGAQRPDPEKIAADLFSRLDTSGQGYIEKSDLQSALDKISSGKSTFGTSSDASELFSALDTDADGKVTQQEFTDTLQKLHDTLEQQFQSSRMQTAMQGGQSGGAGGTNNRAALAAPYALTLESRPIELDAQGIDTTYDNISIVLGARSAAHFWLPWILAALIALAVVGLSLFLLNWAGLIRL